MRVSRDNDGKGDDNVDDVVNETKLVSKEERKSFKARVLPIQLVITKVS
jgi:hypothetical protein